MVTQAELDIPQVWLAYRETGNVEYRNRLVERYLSLVKYNAERIWARLPDGVELVFLDRDIKLIEREPRNRKRDAKTFRIAVVAG